MDGARLGSEHCPRRFVGFPTRRAVQQGQVAACQGRPPAPPTLEGSRQRSGYSHLSGMLRQDYPPVKPFSTPRRSGCLSRQPGEGTSGVVGEGMLHSPIMNFVVSTRKSGC